MEFVQPPSKRLLKPMLIPDRLLLGPGPSNPHPRILKSMSSPMLGHMHPEFFEVMDDIIAGLQYLFQTFNSLTIAVSGTGHAGMEAAFVNVLEEGERVLVLRNGGIWGDRAKEVAERCGGVVKLLEQPDDNVFSLAAIEEGLVAFKPSVLFVCHGESSTGSCQPLRDIGDLCHSVGALHRREEVHGEGVGFIWHHGKHKCLLVVDAVASLGGVPFFMDKWGIDVAYSGSQKVLGAPPGTAPISFSPRARRKMSSRRTKVKSFYFDMDYLSQYWGVTGFARKYHHTGPVSNFYGLREALVMVAEEGLTACWKRHQKNAEKLWVGLEELGLQLHLGNEAIRLPTVTTITVPLGIDWKSVTSYVMERYNLEMAGGLGPTAGKVWRIGLMGYNSTDKNVEEVLSALKQALRNMNWKKAKL